MADLKKALAKLDRPPSGPNWARFVHETKPQSTKAILSFVKGMPSFNYRAATTAIKDHFLLGTTKDTAVSLVKGAGAPAGRQQNRELVEAFFEYDRDRRYPIGTCVEVEQQWFRISRDILVPVSPLVVVREQGKFVPVFLCGWSELALTIGQRRLLMTIYEDAFLSLTDFQSSPAEFLFFPKVSDESGETARIPEVWSRGDYDLLTSTELNDQVARYLEAREDARSILLAAKEAEDRRAEEERRRDVDRADPTGDLFTPTKPGDRKP